MISRIITIDQSTSATKAMLFSEDCELLHRVNIEHQQFYPQIGWVEHDAEEIYKNTIEAIHCLLEQEEVNGKDISYSLAITNQRETVVVWNRHTGKSVYHAVVWQCQRGAAICKELKDKGYSELVQRKTGTSIVGWPDKIDPNSPNVSVTSREMKPFASSVTYNASTQCPLLITKRSLFVSFGLSGQTRIISK